MTSPEVNVDYVQDDKILSDKQGFNLALGHIDTGAFSLWNFAQHFPKWEIFVVKPDPYMDFGQVSV